MCVLGGPSVRVMDAPSLFSYFLSVTLLHSLSIIYSQDLTKELGVNKDRGNKTWNGPLYLFHLPVKDLIEEGNGTDRLEGPLSMQKREQNSVLPHEALGTVY